MEQDELQRRIALLEDQLQGLQGAAQSYEQSGGSGTPLRLLNSLRQEFSKLRYSTGSAISRIQQAIDNIQISVQSSAATDDGQIGFLQSLININADGIDIASASNRVGVVTADVVMSSTILNVGVDFLRVGLAVDDELVFSTSGLDQIIKAKVTANVDASETPTIIPIEITNADFVDDLQNQSILKGDSVFFDGTSFVSWIRTTPEYVRIQSQSDAQAIAQVDGALSGDVTSIPLKPANPLTLSLKKDDKIRIGAYAFIVSADVTAGAGPIPVELQAVELDADQYVFLDAASLYNAIEINTQEIVNYGSVLFQNTSLSINRYIKVDNGVTPGITPGDETAWIPGSTIAGLTWELSAATAIANYTGSDGLLWTIAASYKPNKDNPTEPVIQGQWSAAVKIETADAVAGAPGNYMAYWYKNDVADGSNLGALPTSGAYPSVVTTAGWTDGPTPPGANEYVWQASLMLKGSDNLPVNWSWAGPMRFSGEPGAPGQEGMYIEKRMKVALQGTDPATLITAIERDERAPAGWSTVFPTYDPETEAIFVIEGKIIPLNNGLYKPMDDHGWSLPYQITGERGGPGTDGTSNYYAYWFINAQNQPTTPNNPPNEDPAWTDGPTTPTEPKVTWITKGLIDGDNGGVIGSWSTPAQISGFKGDVGAAGNYPEYRYQKAAHGTTPTLANASVRMPEAEWDTNVPAYNPATESLWMIFATIVGHTPSDMVGDWSGPHKITGEDGADATADPTDERLYEPVHWLLPVKGDPPATPGACKSATLTNPIADGRTRTADSVIDTLIAARTNWIAGDTITDIASGFILDELKYDGLVYEYIANGEWKLITARIAGGVGVFETILLKHIFATNATVESVLTIGQGGQIVGNNFSIVGGPNSKIDINAGSIGGWYLSSNKLTAEDLTGPIELTSSGRIDSYSDGLASSALRNDFSVSRDGFYVSQNQPSDSSKFKATNIEPNAIELANAAGIITLSLTADGTGLAVNNSLLAYANQIPNVSNFITDAPDSQNYVRKNGAWVQLPNQTISDYIKGITFNTLTGVLAVTNAADETTSIDLDNRYLQDVPAEYLTLDEAALDFADINHVHDAYPNVSDFAVNQVPVSDGQGWLSFDVSDMATKTWVNDQNYLTSLPSHDLTTHSDVNIQTPSSGQFLSHDGTQWVNTTIAYSDIESPPDLSDMATQTWVNQRNYLTSLPSHSIENHNDVNIQSPENNHVLQYVNNEWQNGQLSYSQISGTPNLTNYLQNPSGNTLTIGSGATDRLIIKGQGGTGASLSQVFLGNAMGFQDAGGNWRLFVSNTTTTQLYYGSSVKLQTTSAGVTIQGDLAVTGAIPHEDTSSISGAFGGIGKYVESIEIDGNGHVTAISTRTL